MSSKQAIAVETQMEPNSPESFADLTDRIKRSLKNSVDSLIAQLWQNDSDRPGLFDVMASTINIMQDRITKSRMAGDPPDVMLAPQLEHIGLLEVYRAAEAIEQINEAV